MAERKLRMVARSDDDYDLIGDGFVVELSRGGETGIWTFWAVRFDGAETRIGSIDAVFDPDATQRLDAARQALSEQTDEGGDR